MLIKVVLGDYNMGDDVVELGAMHWKILLFSCGGWFGLGWC